jgi:hypothetical protein
MKCCIRRKAKQALSDLHHRIVDRRVQAEVKDAYWKISDIEALTAGAGHAGGIPGQLAHHYIGPSL